MTAEAQRIAIAEACGWKQVRDGIFVGPDKTPHSHLPNFLYDLNAMDKAVWTLSAEAKDRFLLHLEKKVGPQFGFPFKFMCINATAAQRAESFLRAISQWQETPSCGDNAPKSPSSTRATRREEGV